MANGVMRAWDGVEWQSLPAAAPNPGSISQAVNVNFTPTGTVAAGNVQDAIAEVASEATAGIALKANSADLSAATGSTLIGHTQNGTAPVQSLQAHLRRYVRLKGQGAVGDGVTDDSGAIQAAFATLADNSVGDIIVDAGTFRTTTGVSVVNKRFRLIGEGEGISNFKFEQLSGTGIFVTNTDYNQFVTLEGFSCTTNQVNAVTGIQVQFSDADATNNRTQNRLSIRNIQMLGSVPGLTGWQRGFYLINTHAASLENLNVMGATYGTGMSAGYELISQGTGAPSDITFRNCKAYYGINGFKGSGHLEGINFSQCFAIAVAVGWDFRLSAEFPWFTMNQCHANVTSQGVHLENFSQSFITNNLIYIVGHGAGSTPVGISLDGSHHCIISGNNIVNPTPLGGTTVVGIFTNNSNHNKVSDNKVAGYNVAYWLAGTTDFQRTYDNESTSGYGGSVKYNMAASGGSNVQRDTA